MSIKHPSSDWRPLRFQDTMSSYGIICNPFFSYLFRKAMTYNLLRYVAVHIAGWHCIVLLQHLSQIIISCQHSPHWHLDCVNTTVSLRGISWLGFHEKLESFWNHCKGNVIEQRVFYIFISKLFHNLLMCKLSKALSINAAADLHTNPLVLAVK